LLSEKWRKPLRYTGTFLMIEIIENLSNKTGKGWFSVLMIFKDADLVTCKEIKEVENHFFDLEDEIERNSNS
jgi:hypothetical protein